ncbi:hypothetical protein R1flu_009327 [Riccia fluitans]|uniref:Uncharacterized protein n=1 Tax=Riccia fluitans TaxID=41844 RepID=A0ABD1Z211_9MARC
MRQGRAEWARWYIWGTGTAVLGHDGVGGDRVCGVVKVPCCLGAMGQGQGGRIGAGDGGGGMGTVSLEHGRHIFGAWVPQLRGIIPPCGVVPQGHGTALQIFIYF